MLVRGNTKLGRIWNWSIPAIETCPGSTELCRGICYACKGAYFYKNVDKSQQRNWRLSKTKHFVFMMSEFIRQKQLPTVRIHASGDFDTPSYTRRWHQIIKACPDTQFYAYTRSWRKTGLTPEGLIDEVKALSMLPNMRLWLSCDLETGRPPAWRRSPWAYVMLHDLDFPSYPVELVFRNKHKTKMLHAQNGKQVCPYEMGVDPRGTVLENRKMKVSCGSCGICFDSRRKVLRQFEERKRPRRRVRKVA